MKINTLGIVLSYYRKKEKLALDKICSGLCSAATLERIEKGERIADSLLGGLLLERIGKEVSQFELVLDEEDYALWRMREKIREAMHIKNYELAAILLRDYRVAVKNNSSIHEQFCLYHETMIEIANDKENYKKICQTAAQALQITKKKIGKEDKEVNSLYTQTEIRLILLLIQHGYMGLEREAEHELLKLFHYVEYYYTERRKEEVGTAIIMELIALEQKRHNDTRLITYIDKGITLLSQGRGIRGLEDLHFLKAQTLVRQYGGAPSLIERKREIEKECLMAYCICEVMGFTEKMKEIETFCEEKMAWQITGLAILSD